MPTILPASQASKSPTTNNEGLERLQRSKRRRHHNQRTEDRIQYTIIPPVLLLEGAPFTPTQPTSHRSKIKNQYATDFWSLLISGFTPTDGDKNANMWEDKTTVTKTLTCGRTITPSGPL
jgi:hypothetical protein